LRAIAAFEAAARHESFAKAAEELNLSHSAISHAIRGLEERLTSRLFDRHGRTVALTAGGRSLAARLRLSLTLLADAFEDPAPAGQRRLVVGAAAVVAEKVLTPRLASFRAAHPEVEVELRCDVAADGVARGDLDVEVQYGGERLLPGLTSRLLAHESLFPVMRPDLRGAERPHAPGDLAAWPLIHSLEHPWALWFARIGIGGEALNRAVAVEGGGVTVQAARMGLGVGLARGLLAQADLASGALIRLFDIEVPAPGAYHAVWNPRSPREGLAQGFVEWLCADLRDTAPTPAVLDAA